MNNEYQELAIQHKEGPCIVIAPPGSGKTYVLMNRIRNLVERQQVSEESILVVTFTKMAAGEMKERYELLTNQKTSEVIFGTFHSVFLGIIIKETDYTREGLLSQGAQQKLVTYALRNVGYQYEVCEELVENILKEVSRWKNLGYGTPLLETYPDYGCDGVEEEVFCKVYQILMDERKRRKQYDFDDIMLLCYELFLTRKEVLLKYQKKLQYILVDEFQDSNPLQYQMIQLLASPRNNLFVVGDDDQSIYGFRGSNPSIMQQFIVDYPSVNQIILNQNYRSSKEIVAESKCLISKNENRFVKEYEAYQPSNRAVEYILLDTTCEQELVVMKLIREHLTTKEGSLAIITRTTAQLEPYIRLLRQCKVSHKAKMIEKSVYEHQVAKDIMAYLRYTHVEKTAKDLRYILNKPCTYITQKSFSEYDFTQQQLEKYYANNHKMLLVARKFLNQLELASSLDPYAAIVYFRKSIGYDRYVQEKEQEGNNGSWQEVLGTLQEESKEYSNVIALLEHWNRKKVQQDKKEKEKEKERIHLMTMHGSKGLEFHTVILPDLVEGSVPHHKAKTKEALEEERRLLYVAMTRAKEALYCLSVHEKGDNPNKVSSPFFQELYQSGRSSSSSINSSYSEFARYCSNTSEIASNSSSLSIYSKSGS